ncbi:MAG TPA: hypothetical protein VH054_02830 [Polyangiaceae bacterium]|jgi:hypothetical protein|nr:hypothetical protein [Polyangiaceae bacterium]
MPPEQVLAELVELAKRTGIRVRFDEVQTTSSSKGGLCIVRGEPLVVIDVHASPIEQAEILAAALHRFGVWPMYLPRHKNKRFALRH